MFIPSFKVFILRVAESFMRVVGSFMRVAGSFMRVAEICQKLPIVVSTE